MNNMLVLSKCAVKPLPSGMGSVKDICLLFFTFAVRIEPIDNDDEEK